MRPGAYGGGNAPASTAALRRKAVRVPDTGSTECRRVKNGSGTASFQAPPMPCGMGGVFFGQLSRLGKEAKHHFRIDEIFVTAE